MPSIAGDFNDDGFVDGEDFLVWQLNGGSSADLAVWQANYGTSPQYASAAAVPEPSQLLILLSAGVSIITCRRICRESKIAN